MKILLEVLENGEVIVSLKHAKLLREGSGKTGGKLSKKDISIILSEAPTKRRLRNISLPDEVSERLAGYSVSSEKVNGDIISIYLDMLERCEVEDVFGNKENSED